MISHPTQADFTKIYEADQAQLVWHEMVADLETPVAAYMKLADTEPYAFLLESVEDGDITGRYSMIGLAPDLIFRTTQGKAEINRHYAEGGLDFEPIDAAPLDALRQLLAQTRLPMPENMPPMAAGIFGYMSYDMVRYMERVPNNNPDTLKLPECLFIRPTLIAVFDKISHNIRLVTPVYPTSDKKAGQAYADAVERLALGAHRLAAALPDEPVTEVKSGTPQSNISQQDYFDMVARARDYIIDGDVFQVVLSQRFSMPFTLPPFSLYRALRRVNPSPYLFYLKMDDFSIIGSSPEVLVGVKDRITNIRPIAGTRKRGANAAEDEKIGADLLADEKERAEHLMLLDLGRNDVGRVSEIGSVQVNEAFNLQKTSHLIHIVSDVTGKLLPDLDEIDALVAGFPAGTVSGAPKIRAMEIIDELEQMQRGIYAGCVGYFSANGDMDTCIALRTGVIKNEILYVQAGGGVVYDSTPQYEYDETVNKAAALFRAANEALEQAQKRSNR
ncbi:MAG: anthranilate synthase component I [Parvibaculales bacterium]